MNPEYRLQILESIQFIIGELNKIDVTDLDNIEEFFIFLSTIWGNLYGFQNLTYIKDLIYTDLLNIETQILTHHEMYLNSLVTFCNTGNFPE
jgi:hypothetical protein